MTTERVLNLAIYVLRLSILVATGTSVDDFYAFCEQTNEPDSFLWDIHISRDTG